MLDWLFGKKKKPEEKKPQVSSPTTNKTTDNKNKGLPTSPTKEAFEQDTEADQWIYESLLQYLTSPLWKVPIYSFIDENCIVFDAEEENKFGYTEIHKKFKKMIEDMVANLLTELGINEEQLEAQIVKGLKNKPHRKIFEQLLIVDNFIVFKKLMVKRNKELELEAMRQLEGGDTKLAGDAPPEKSSTTGAPVNHRLEKAQLQKEQAEVEHAIAMSLTLDLERKKMQDAEDFELQEALRLSEQEFQTAQKKSEPQIKAEPVVKKEAPKKEEPKTEEPKIQEPKKEQPKVEITPKPEEPKTHVSIATSPIKFQADKEEEKKEVFSKGKLGPLKGKGGLTPNDEIAQMLGDNSDTKKGGSSLPPLLGHRKYDSKPVEELVNEQQNIAKKIEEINATEDKSKVESLEERKKRLQAQRDIILAKKKAEGLAELKKYEQDTKAGIQPKSSGTAIGDMNKEDILLKSSTTLPSNVDDEETKKRKEIYQKLKEQS
jgi:UDP-N-acetylglucosamine transferase subunit ALG13